MSASNSAACLQRAAARSRRPAVQPAAQPAVHQRPEPTLMVGSAPALSSSVTLPSSFSLQAMSSSRSQGWVPPAREGRPGGWAGAVRSGQPCVGRVGQRHGPRFGVPHFAPMRLPTLTCKHRLAAIVVALQEVAGSRSASGYQHSMRAWPAGGTGSVQNEGAAHRTGAGLGSRARPAPAGPAPTSDASMPMYIKYSSTSLAW